MYINNLITLTSLQLHSVTLRTLPQPITICTVAVEKAGVIIGHLPKKVSSTCKKRRQHYCKNIHTVKILRLQENQQNSKNFYLKNFPIYGIQ